MIYVSLGRFQRRRQTHHKPTLQVVDQPVARRGAAAFSVRASIGGDDDGEERGRAGKIRGVRFISVCIIVILTWLAWIEPDGED